MARLSKNIEPLRTIKELSNEINYDSFEYKDKFLHLCNLLPNWEREKLEIEIINEDNFKNNGLVYVFVIDGKIFKIGHTINNIKDRVQSYNCGKASYRSRGTNSITNYFVLQSFLNLRKTIKVYAFFTEKPKYKVFGKVYQDGKQPAKTAESIIINDFIKNHNKKPIGCTQT